MTRRCRWVLLLAVPLAMTLALCAAGWADDAGTAIADAAMSSDAAAVTGLSHRFMIQPRNVRALLRRRDTVLLSAQSKLEIADAGFVNSAVPVDVDEITDFGQTPDAFSNFAGWSERFGALGITTRSTVIIYDDGELKFASRVRFLLDYFGVRRAFLLNGGFNALLPLIANGRLTETAPGVATLADFEVKVRDRPIHLVDRQLVASVLGDPSVKLIDVRTPAEFAGCLLLPGIKRGGHIPGAQNLPIEDLLTPQATNQDLAFLDRPRELYSIFRTARLRHNDRIIVYCQDGAKSSLAALSLIQAGYTNVSLYYLSYLDWQEDQTAPVESIGPCQ